MKGKKYLPIIITSFVAGAVFIGIGILTIVKLTGKKDADKRSHTEHQVLLPGFLDGHEDR